jgi:O-succinylbenzoate synthase
LGNKKFFDFINNSTPVEIDYIWLKKYESVLNRQITVKNRDVVYYNRPILFVEVHGGGLVGYGECSALESPYYTSEYCDEAIFVLQYFILDLLRSRFGTRFQIGELNNFLAKIQGHNMAKSAVEMAVIDLTLKRQNISLRSLLDSTTDIVKFGGVVDGTNAIAETLDEVKTLVNLGYSRIKVKVNPSVSPKYLRDIRNEFNDLEMFVDANESFESFKAALDYFKEIEDCNLTMIEQPFDRDEILSNTRLGGLVAPPICLDEPIISVKAGKSLIETGACDIPCVKVGRMGGIIEVLRFHEVMEESGIFGYIGGNFSSDLAKWVDCLLASLPQFNMIADISLKNRGPDLNLSSEIGLEVVNGGGKGFKIIPETTGLGRKFNLDNDKERVSYEFNYLMKR